MSAASKPRYLALLRVRLVIQTESTGTSRTCLSDQLKRAILGQGLVRLRVNRYGRPSGLWLRPRHGIFTVAALAKGPRSEPGDTAYRHRRRPGDIVLRAAFILFARQAGERAPTSVRYVIRRGW